MGMNKVERIGGSTQHRAVDEVILENRQAGTGRVGGKERIREVSKNWESLLDGGLNPSVAVNYPERLPKKFFNLVISLGETSIKFTPHR